MSQHVPGALKTFKAAADYSAKQYYAMYVSADNTVTIGSAATQALVGTLLNEPAAANDGAVIAMSGTSKGIAGASVSIGDLLTTDSAGKLIATTTTGNKTVGVALEAADANDIFEYAVSLGKHY